MTISIAWYVAPPTDISEWVIRLLQGRCTHCELVFMEDDGLRLCISSSSRDGGVRAKYIDLDSGSWELTQLDALSPIQCQVIRDWCDAQMGKKYDWTGILLGSLTHLFSFSKFFQRLFNVTGIPDQDSSKYFCSEFTATALNQILPNQQFATTWITPQQLKDLFKVFRTGVELVAKKP